jgi:hypothetical protein
MPDKVLRIVAVLLVICAVGGFALGFAGAPKGGRLPGEAAPGGEGAPMAATEARALNTDELAPPKPPEPAEEPEKEEEKAPEPQTPVEKAPVLKAPEPVEQPDQVGDLLAAPPPPPPEDPPF